LSGAASYAAGGFSGDAGGTGQAPSRTHARPLLAEDDRRLLNLAGAGNREAFGVLVERHHGTLACVLRQKLGPRAPLEDLLQEVFARTLRSVDRFQGRSSFVTWATTIGLNLAIDWGRKNQRRTRLAPTADADADEVACPAAGRALELVERRDEAQRASLALDGLPDDLRLAVTLRVVQDLPYEEVARRLAAPVPRVRTWVSRGLKKLRVALSDQEVDDGAA